MTRSAQFITAFLLVFLASLLTLGVKSPVALGSSNQTAPVNAAHILPVKRTPQALYLTSRQAYEFVTKRPDILFIDVRDPVEVSLHGHPKQIDAIVPVKVFGDTYDEDLQEFELVENQRFLKDMASFMAELKLPKTHQIIVTCGSGWRSAKAAKKLADAGYTNVWHIVDGYPGEYKPGVNSRNAWKLAGLPWTTTADVWGSAWRRALGEWL